MTILTIVGLILGLGIWWLMRTLPSAPPKVKAIIISPLTEESVSYWVRRDYYDQLHKG